MVPVDKDKWRARKASGGAELLTKRCKFVREGVRGTELLTKR